jgi:ABC-type multidrug transport system fused ATPase/permease subunit
MVHRRPRRYLQSLRWIIATVFRFKPLKATLIVGLVAVGRSLQAAAFAGIIAYFSAVQHDQPVDVLGYLIEPRDGMWMTIIITAVALSMVGATFVVYVSSRMGFHLSMAFAEHVLSSVMTLEGAYPPRQALGRKGTMSLQAQEITAGKQVLFRPVNMLMSLPRRLLLVLPALVGMFWIAGKIVIFLALFATPAIALNYVISRRVVVARQTSKEVQREYRQEMRDTIDEIGDETRPVGDRDRLAEALIEGEANKASVKFYSSLLLAPRQSEFVSSTIAAAAVASIGLYLGYEAIYGRVPLALLVGFFVLLRVAVNGLTGIAVSLTTYARFYGVVRSAYEYLTSPIPPARFTGQPVLHAPKRDVPVPGALEEDVRVERGVPVAIVSPAEINRYTQYFFAFALTQRARQGTREKLNAATLRCTAALLDPDRMERLGLKSDDEAGLIARLEAAGITDIAPSAETIRKAAADVESISGADIARIALTACVLSSADLVVVDPGLISALEPDELKRWIAALSDRFVAIGYQIDRFSGCIAGETHAIILDSERAAAVVTAEDAVAASESVESEVESFEEVDLGMDDVE